MADINTRISDFVWKNLNERHVVVRKEPVWESLTDKGSELWLDTCDIDRGETIWTSEMSGITTNNSLMNIEIQKGYYDVLISESKSIVRDLPNEERIREIAFIINARNSLRMAQKFNCPVCVELHTDISHDIKAILNYGKRYHEICPDKFVISVPFTPEGLIAARALKDSGVRVNVTQEFSARQSVVAIKLVRPDFLNIFSHRIADYIVKNNLGNGEEAAIMSVIASQNWITGQSAENPWQTKLIVSDFHRINQMKQIAGADVVSISPDVASEGKNDTSLRFTSKIHDNFETSHLNTSHNARIEKFWEVNNAVLSFGDKLAEKTPSSAAELIRMAHEEGCEDIFPVVSKEEKCFLLADGKIPAHPKWENKINEGKIAPDTLLSMAGLYSLKADQALLDQRIKGIIE
jgi:transaldolase